MEQLSVLLTLFAIVGIPLGLKFIFSSFDPDCGAGREELAIGIIVLLISAGWIFLICIPENSIASDFTADLETGRLTTQAPEAPGPTTATNHCPNCNHTLGEGANFCPNCGSSVTQSAPNCTSCGGKLSETDNYCPSCGAKKAKNNYPPTPPRRYEGTPSAEGVQRLPPEPKPEEKGLQHEYQ